ncbi:hypothetical protein J8F10_27395 [Gemmata sp. G18]|uniref:Uncharacterized protein n=1 Tax=Gemmata palustris TaxID=2822762 RepID=A0ABS5BZ35_9BACT|nr:hypothetical protein [Gemmata palustris]MBP3958986.1 hypothetical protein [Gemmata palustris]
MKRRLLGMALLGAAVWMTTGAASGFGGRKKADCSSPCGTTAGCGTPCSSYSVSYVDKKVTAYKTEWEAKDVKVTVNEWVTSKEDYKYWVNEPETKKQKVKVKEQATKDEAFKYWVNEWVTSKEKIKVAECKAVTKDVEVTTYDLKPTVTKQKRTISECVCVPVTVTCAAPAPSCDSGRGGLFSRLCKKKKHDDCAAPCGTPCDAPCAPVVTKTVMQRQLVTKEIEVDVTTYEKIPKKSIQKVTTNEIVWVEKEIDVKKCVAVEKTGTRKVCVWVDVEKDVDVTTWKKVEKTGTRDVRKCVAVEKTVKQQFAKQVAYETTVKVAVYTPVVVPAPAPVPCETPCASPCSTTGSSKPARGGLFRGHCCK